MLVTERIPPATAAVHTCWVPNGALLPGEVAQWWSASDGSGMRGFCQTPVVDERWEPLQLLTDVRGASDGEHAGFFYVVETDVPPEAEADFNAWYEMEHLPGLARVPGTVRARRYRRLLGGPQYMACYDLVTPQAMESLAWLAVRHTAWSSRVRPLFRNTARTLHVLPGAA